MLPPDVASPMGNVAWDEKSIIVVKNGKINKPFTPAEMQTNQNQPVSNPIHIIMNPVKAPTKKILHFFLYSSFNSKPLPAHPTNPAAFAMIKMYPHCSVVMLYASPIQATPTKTMLKLEKTKLTAKNIFR